jgi:hypothetical protein
LSRVISEKSPEKRVFRRKSSEETLVIPSEIEEPAVSDPRHRRLAPTFLSNTRPYTQDNFAHIA